MESLAHMLTGAELERLRASYDAAALLDLKVSATSASHPAHAPWTAAIRATFFGASSLPAPQRELCVITLLSFRAPDLSLATHVYAALMEGVSVEQVCEAVGLAGCYGGLPAYYESIATVRKTLMVMKRLASEPAPEMRQLLMELVAVFTGQSPTRAEP